MVDDTRLELAEACRFAPGIRRLFRLSKLKLEFGHKLRVLIPEEKRKPTAQISCRLLVDDTRLELVIKPLKLLKNQFFFKLSYFLSYFL